ncbi:GDSL esterase/lipase [Trifolium pratense]|uniref:GDSL esterase/lipase n=1 Tax=Trifolium pratense TaxID=57577 RepID=A0A2K3NDG3_TRIPR|nr:GDSL esterase/lipase [Trifolium pratense]
MESMIKAWLVMPILFLSANYLQQCVNGKSQVPCLFIFGDSLSDSGNNNNLPTSSKANYNPYGIDFPFGPTGRFTNGRTAIDIITQLLGFEEFIPPFANINGSDILKGVNYAAGGAGIRSETSMTSGFIISLGMQLKNHRDIVSQIAGKLGSVDKAQQYLNKCLYYVNIGSNDYINNYYLPQYYPTSLMYSPDQYAEALIQELSLNLLAWLSRFRSRPRVHSQILHQAKFWAKQVIATVFTPQAEEMSPQAKFLAVYMLSHFAAAKIERKREKNRVLEGFFIQHQSRIKGGSFWVYSRVGEVILTPCKHLSLKSLGQGKRFGKRGLHDIGARKYVLVGLGLLGCVPYTIDNHGTNGSCVDEENDPAYIYNAKLKSLVDNFNKKFSLDSKFIFINSTLESDVQNPDRCFPDERPCYNRSDYVFWDDAHPTEAWNQLTAIRSYEDTDDSGYTYPMDIKQLVEQETMMKLEPSASS